MELSETTYDGPRSTLTRLLRMGPRELACRGRQAAFKWVERLNGPSIDRQQKRGYGLVDGFLRNAKNRFFEGPLDPRLPATLRMSAPRHCEEVIAIADEICHGRFDLLGYRGLDFGASPDWHFDPITNRRAPLLHWSLINPLDATTVGDSKVIWELNRHQWMVQLAQAYRLTGDERYAQTIVRHLQSWLRENPPGIGINWASSLEVSFRLIAWCWTLLLIRDSRSLTSEVLAEVVESIQKHATHVERYLSYYFSPNTHLTGEALGLLYAGVVCREMKRAERWRSLASRILVDELARQVLPDGVYLERSTYYQRYTVDIYLHFMLLASRGGLELPVIVGERVQSLLDFLIAVRHPDGSMPNIGDGDGGLLLPLSRIRPDDYRASFSTAAVLFDSPTYAWAAREIAPETMWLLGTSSSDDFVAIEQSAPDDSSASRLYQDGGFAVMRSGWDEKAHSLIFDTGPLGCQFSSGHGHADLLSVQCCAFGQPYLVDAGTYCYTANEELRNFFRGTAAHSTVMVDGKTQSEPAGPFSWQIRSSASLLRWGSNENLAFADAEHDAYTTLSDPVMHRRQVILVKRRYWIVIDDVLGADRHRVEVRFQFAPMDVRIDNRGWVRATRDGRQGLMLRSFTTAPMEPDVREGRRDPFDGWISPNYGQLERAPMLVYAATASLPLRFVTLLWPTEDIGQENPDVNVISLDGRPVGLTLPELRESVTFDEPAVTSH